MENFYGDVVIVTGASSGIGKAAAEYLMKNGFKVYGTSRHPKESCRAEDKESGGFLEMIKLDVCSDESVHNAIDYVYQKEGTINILINCAGFGIAGSVEDTTADEAYKQLDTNFFGVLRMCRCAAPIMRKQKKGLIINVSSVAGVIPIPFQSMYSASKYALEAVSEAMRMEIKPFGVRVSMVEPGDTKTGFTEKREFTAASKNNSVYSSRFELSIDTMAKSETNGPGPEIVVKSIVRIIKSKNPPVRVTVGFEYKVIRIIKGLVPARFLDFALSKIYC